ncbi:MAG: tetratricopeptide repeat protein [Phycisphaerae bacterium]
MAGFGAVAAVLCACSGPAHAALAPAIVSLAIQEQQYREREVLDPTSDEWAAQPPATQGSPESTVDEARSHLARGNPARARDLLAKWVKTNRDHPRHLEAVYLLGEAEFETKDFNAAYENFELVIQDGAGELYSRALRREVDIARAYLAGEKKIIWGVLRLPAEADGVQILDRVYERVPGSRLGEDALRYKAEYYFNRGDMDLAQTEYANLAREYPSGRYVRQATLRAAEAADASYAGTPFDGRPLIEAEERYKTVQLLFPDFAKQERVAERLDSIDARRADKDLYIAQWYERTGQRGAAEFYYRIVVDEWSESLAAAAARSRLRAMGIELAPEPGGVTPSGGRDASGGG